MLWIVWLTENLHSEKQTGASSDVRDHTAVLAAVLRPDFLYLEVLTPCQPLDTTSQLKEKKKGVGVRDFFSFCLKPFLDFSTLYLKFGLILVPLYFWSRIAVSQALQGQMSINWH